MEKLKQLPKKVWVIALAAVVLAVAGILFCYGRQRDYERGNQALYYMDQYQEILDTAQYLLENDLDLDWFQFLNGPEMIEFINAYAQNPLSPLNEQTGLGDFIYGTYLQFQAIGKAQGEGEEVSQETKDLALSYCQTGQMICVFFQKYAGLDHYPMDQEGILFLGKNLRRAQGFGLFLDAEYEDLQQQVKQIIEALPLSMRS